ncbi:DUF6543 domain-containing protein [Pseudomonas sp. CC120222-01a]|uniref:DUF6543 domain-containing protein n=1 Tax=Pseudomonas sp. CC120222-01a TaxID=1378075 RepID=UPI000D90D22A|nr:DUF6543 domain-containing protein [Pseudomonas sp. CC120222-01a]PVZ43140.1 hypothetical protein N430_00828 [Pseudomonas sp. CC120222-01a]
MHASSPSSTITFKQAVAACFRKRPGLREVLADEAFKALIDRYPMIPENYPQLSSLDGFAVMRRASSPDDTRPVSLLDELLRHYLAGTPLQLTTSDALTLAAPAVFLPQPQGIDSTRQPRICLDMAKLDADLEKVLGKLPNAFAQAQISFWNGFDEHSDTSRAQWLANLIKAALLNNIPRQGLDAEDQALLYAMLEDAGQNVAVNVIQITLSIDGKGWSRLLPDLLLSSGNGSDQRVLWCKPSGVIRRYIDRAGFATALQEELADRYRYDSLSWAQRPLSGASADFQAMQLLNGMLDDLRRLRVTGLGSIDALEKHFAAACDPSGHFLEQPLQVPDLPAIALPGWLEKAGPQQRFAYQGALLDLAASQGQSRGRTSLGDIDDIQRYARRRLCEQMRLDHPGESPCDPDHVFISIDQVLASSLPAQPQAQYLRDESLTALAIARLGPGEVMARISERQGQSHTGWLTIRHVEALIRSVDIAGTYPAYLRSLVNAQPRKHERIAQFAREWRQRLRFDTLKARIDQQLSEAQSAALLVFCNGAGDEQQAIAPLTLRRQPGVTTSDRVHGMFLIQLPDSWVLYRPLHDGDPLLAFTSRELMLEHVRSHAEVQKSVLDALDDDARPIYEKGGLRIPHLHVGLDELEASLNFGSVVTELALEKTRHPVEVAFSPWSSDLDGHLLDARVEAMLHFAARRSVSNAQIKGELVRQVAWAIFNGATLLWRGPLAGITWLIVALSASADDLRTLAEGSDDARIMAATDLLTNLAMLVVPHGAEAVPQPERAPLLHFAEPAERGSNRVEVASPVQERNWHEAVLEQQSVLLSGSRWGDGQRLDKLSSEQRQALARLQARQSLPEQARLETGRLHGLYRVDGRLYVKLADAAFEVQESWSGMRIIGPDLSKGEWVAQGGSDDGYHIVGRERAMGPWVSRWNGEWSISLNLPGGAPVKTPDKIEQRRLVNRLLANQAPLKEVDAMINSNLATLAPLDEHEKAYSQVLTEQRSQQNQEILVETPRMADMRVERDRLRATHASTVRAISKLYEQRAVLLQSNIELLNFLKTPAMRRFGSIDYQAEVGPWYETLIQNDAQLYTRLLSQVSYESIDRQALAITRLPATPAQRDAYAAYRQTRECALAIHKRLLGVSQRLDEVITEALDDPRIVYPQKHSHLREIIDTRPYSTLVVHAQIISDLQALTLDRMQLNAENVDRMYQEQLNLRNKDMHQAMLSHDGLLRADPSVQDQIAVLESSLQQYKTGLGTARYLLTLADPAWHMEHLQAYIRETTTLRHMAERALDHANARLDAEQHPNWPVARPAPPARPQNTRRARLRVIRTARHKALLVDETLRDGKAVQYDPVAMQPVAEYEAQGNTWVELQPQPRASQKALRSLGTRLVAETDDEIARARLFDDEPNSLTEVLDHHIERMTAVTRQLERQSSPTLLDNLNAAIERVQKEKHNRLKAIYLATRHPDSKALRFLLQHNLVEIRPTVTRRPLGQRDFLDVYTLYRTESNSNAILWEAHFHYTRQDAAPRDFAKGHLKFATAKMRDAQLEDALSPHERLKVYRGDLTYEQVKDLIPFPTA